MNAVFFGSIGSVVETSEPQRKSFNDAFAEAGLMACFRALVRGEVPLCATNKTGTTNASKPGCAMKHKNGVR